MVMGIIAAALFAGVIALLISGRPIIIKVIRKEDTDPITQLSELTLPEDAVPPPDVDLIIQEINKIMTGDDKDG